MVEFEADDAIAAAAARFADDPRVEQILICTPDKDMAQLRPRRARRALGPPPPIVYDDAGVRAKWGVPPASVPDRLALVGDAADGFPGLPGWGVEVGRRGPGALRRFARGGPAGRPTGTCPGFAGHQRSPPRSVSAWPMPSSSGISPGCARRRADPQTVAWTSCAGGTPRSAWEAFCDEWGLARLRLPAALAGPPTPEPACASVDGRAELREWADGGRRRDHAELAGPARHRTRGRRRRRVTRAPPRSAMSPAAATSQADRPPCWTNASNRPFAT